MGITAGLDAQRVMTASLGAGAGLLLLAGPLTSLQTNAVRGWSACSLARLAAKKRKPAH